MYQLLIDNISRHIDLTDDEKKLFISFLHEKKIKKRNYFLQQGEICSNLAFVLSGCMRSYLMDKNGFEHILHFAIEDWWIGDMFSITSDKPGSLNIDALEDSHLAILSRRNQLELFDKCPKFERYFRIITEKGMVSFQRRILDNISLPASERYEIFAKKYPEFIQRLSQTQIAAYIGITPEFLSKIRNQIAHKKI